MGVINVPSPVKLIAALMFVDEVSLTDGMHELSERYGEIDSISDCFPFDFTDYYADKMGRNLQKVFVSFEKLIASDTLSGIKIATNKIEENLGKVEAGKLKRRINIDPGYVTGSKLILASTKDYSHRIYLRDGIYAEVTLIYRDKRFEVLEWTYPDYKQVLALEFFAQVRKKYQLQLQSQNISLREHN